MTLKDVDNRDLWSIGIVPQPQLPSRSALVAQHA